MLIGVALKGTIHYYIGAQTYESRVSALAAGDGCRRRRAKSESVANPGWA